MTNTSPKPPKGSTDASQKTGLVQFRADETLLKELTSVAERLHTPVGVLARLWVTERLAREQSFDIEALELWRQGRYSAIEESAETLFADRPLQIIHLAPFQRWLEIAPENISKLVGLLTPVERTDSFEGRINLEGFRTAKQFDWKDTLEGYVQVFTNGQLESVRQLMCDENESLYADFVDSDLVSAIWTYGAALEHLGIRPPVAVFVRFQGIKGFVMRSTKRTGPSSEIDYESFNLKPLIINNWGQVDSIESTAQLIKPILDKLANSAGLPKSISYTASGQWIGLNEKLQRYEPKKNADAGISQQVVKLSGTNRSGQRVDLLLHGDREEDSIVIGKVRPSYSEPTNDTRVSCFVNQNEMAEGALGRLEQLRDLKQPVSISAGNIRFSGLIQALTEGYGAGAFDGINIPQDKVLMIELIPLPKAPTPGKCAKCGRRIGPGQGINNRRHGTLCRQCYG